MLVGTWFPLVSPWMPIAQDFNLFLPRMLIAQDLNLVRLGCWLHRTSTWVASDAECTRFNLGLPRMLNAHDLILVCLECWLHRISFGLPRMLIVQDFILLIFAWTYTFDASLIRIRNSLKLQFVWVSFFLPESLSEAFIKCETLFHSVLLFQIRNIYLMQCMIVHEWNVCALDSLLWFFSLLNLPPSRPCIFCGLVGTIFFCSALEDISVSMLAHRIISRFSLFETKPFLFKPLCMKYRFFRSDFTTLALSINFAWIMKNHQCHAII